MNARLFDMLHDARDMDILAVAEGVDIQFHRARQVAVEQHRAVAGHDHRIGDVALEAGLIADDLHRAATQNVGGADHQRKADFLGDFHRFGVGMGDAVVWLFQAKVQHKLLETLAVFGQIDHVGRGAKDRDAGLLQAIGKLQGGLAAELNDDAVQRAVLLLDAQDFHHVFKGQRLKVQAIRGVIVGRNRLGVAVDHDGLIARVGQRIASVAAAVVELDALADAVRATAEDDDLFTV